MAGAAERYVRLGGNVAALVEEGVRRVSPIRDRAYVWLIGGAILLLAVAGADELFGIGWLSIVASVVAGALIGCGVSRYYYQRASEELSLLMRALQNEGVVEFEWENGKPVSAVIRLSSSMDGGGGFYGDLTVGDSEAPPEQG